jgi:hypothetical protein
MQKLIKILDADFHRWLVKYPVGFSLMMAGFVLDGIIALPFAPLCWWQGQRQRRNDRRRKDKPTLTG